MSAHTATQQQLATLLNAHSENGHTLRLDEAQAFLLALISGPDPVDAAVWLPEILGDESRFDAAEKQHMGALISAWVADMRAELAQGRLPEMVLYADEHGQPDYYAWCNAYLYALDIAPSDWFTDPHDEAFGDLFYPVMCLGGMYDATAAESALIDIDAAERQALQQQLPERLLAIYRHWRAHSR